MSVKVDGNHADRVIHGKYNDMSAINETQHKSGEMSGVDARVRHDNAALSEKAQLLAKAREALNQLPTERTPAVSEIQAQVDAGEYEIDIDDLAEELAKRVDFT